MTGNDHSSERTFSMAGSLPRLVATVLATCGPFIPGGTAPAHWAGLTLLGQAYAAASAQAPHPASAEWSPLDSPRVRVWSDRGSAPASGKLASIRVTLDGGVEYRAPGAASAAATNTPPGGYAVVIELKDVKVAPLPNATGYPLAFPRPNVRKVMENDRVVIWDYTWTSGVPTPMHYHDKDVIVTYLEDGALRSTDPGGNSVINEHYFGFTKLNSRDRVHTEELIKGKARAIIVELK
jgi:hypothetical protein